jgi:hypothetical protein
LCDDDVVRMGRDLGPSREGEISEEGGYNHHEKI